MIIGERGGRRREGRGREGERGRKREKSKREGGRKGKRVGGRWLITIGVNDIFKLAPGPMKCNRATFLGAWDEEPGKTTRKRASNSSLWWCVKGTEAQILVLPFACCRLPWTSYLLFLNLSFIIFTNDVGDKNNNTFCYIHFLLLSLHKPVLTIFFFFTC